MAASDVSNGEKEASLRHETDLDIARIKTLFNTYYEHLNGTSSSQSGTHASLEEGDLHASTVLGLLFENRWGAVNGLMDPSLFQVGHGKSTKRTGTSVKGHAEEALQEEAKKGPLQLDVFGNTAVSLLAFVKALMTMENEDVEAAACMTDACVQYCANDSSVTKKSNKDPHKIIFDTAHAEAKLAGSVLLFLQPSLTHALQGGWALRKCYNQFFDCLERAQIRESLIRECGSAPISSSTLQQFYSQWEGPKSEDHVAVFPNLLPSESKEEIKKTMPISVASSILFGMGGFQLVLSLLPPTVQKIINFFGFQGNRHYGISCLRMSFLSGGLHAPLALCVLVAYYIGTALWLRSPSSEMMEEARLLLELALHIYPSSVLLHWLQARWYRAYRNPLSAFHELRKVANLQHMPLDQQLAIKDVPGRQTPADDDSIGWRGMKSICLYELGWISCLLVEEGKQNERFSEAAHYFHRLRLLSMWSISFYSYLAGSCFLAAGDIQNAVALLKEVENNVQQKSGRVPPIEQLATRRSRRTLRSIESKSLDFKVRLYDEEGKLHPANFTCFFPVLELMYLWNGFSQSQSLCEWTIWYTDQWLRTYDSTPKERLFSKEDITRNEESKGFLKLGKRSTHSNSEEDLALCLLIRASALQCQDEFERAMECLDRVQEDITSGILVPGYQGCYIEPAMHLEKGLTLLAQKKTKAASESLAMVHQTCANVQLGNRLSFRAQQVETSIEEQKL